MASRKAARVEALMAKLTLIKMKATMVPKNLKTVEIERSFDDGCYPRETIKAFYDDIKAKRLRGEE